MTPPVLSLSDPPDHVNVQATYVSEFMSSGDTAPDALCNALRQNLLDQGQSLAGVLGNTHIIDVDDLDLPPPRVQLNAALTYDEDEDPYYETAVAELPLRIRCLGNPAIAEQFLPGDDAPGGIATPEDFTLISAGLSVSFDGQPASEPAVYEGSCSVDGTVEVTIAANLSGAAQYQVLHLSEANLLTASTLEAVSLDQVNNGGYWEFGAWSRALRFALGSREHRLWFARTPQDE
jgi:hypothetical protein